MEGEHALINTFTLKQIIESTDGGATWTEFVPSVGSSGNIEYMCGRITGTLVAYTQGSYRTWQSTDGGHTWSEPWGQYPTSVGNSGRGLAGKDYLVGWGTNGNCYGNSQMQAWLPSVTMGRQTVIGGDTQFMAATNPNANISYLSVDGGANFNVQVPIPVQANWTCIDGRDTNLILVGSGINKVFILESEAVWALQSHESFAPMSPQAYSPETLVSTEQELRDAVAIVNTNKKYIRTAAGIIIRLSADITLTSPVVINCDAEVWIYPMGHTLNVGTHGITIYGDFSILLTTANSKVTGSAGIICHNGQLIVNTGGANTSIEAVVGSSSDVQVRISSMSATSTISSIECTGQVLIQKECLGAIGSINQTRQGWVLDRRTGSPQGTFAEKAVIGDIAAVLDIINGEEI
jgi:hypothetical protein